MQLTWPEFADRFLATVVDGIARRRRALRHRGELKVWFPDTGDRSEWVSLSLEVATRRAVILSLWARHRAALRVISTANRDRGDVLFDLTDLRLPADADRIVAGFEVTAHLVAVGRVAETFERPVTSIWSGLSLSVRP